MASGRRNLEDALALLPTPHAQMARGAGRRGTGGPNLQTAVTDLLPTPTARDGKGMNQRADRTCLPGAVLPLATPRSTGESTRPP